MKRKKPKNIILGHLNINSIKSKFESVWELIKDTFDIFIVSETKLDSSFPDDQFSIRGYRTVRKDRDRNGGGLLLYISEDIPFDNLTLKNSNEQEILGITIDRTLMFHQHIKKMCRKAGPKNWVLYRDSFHTLIPIKGKQYTLPWSNLN